MRVHRDPDQYATDLSKCLKYINHWWREKYPSKPEEPDTVVDIAIFAGLGGRADQAFSLLHHLYMNAASHADAMESNIYLVADESIMFLLDSGSNRIHSPVSPGLFTPNVGIIPVGRRSIISTHGLEWDVENWPTEFGGQMSTSNHIVSEAVTVDATEPVLFTMEYSSIQH